MYSGIQSEQGFRRDGMGRVADSLPRLCRMKNERRLGSLAGVDEQHQVAVLQIQRVLDLKLEFLDDFDRGIPPGFH